MGVLGSPWEWTIEEFSWVDWGQMGMRTQGIRWAGLVPSAERDDCKWSTFYCQFPCCKGTSQEYSRLTTAKDCSNGELVA